MFIKTHQTYFAREVMIPQRPSALQGQVSLAAVNHILCDS